MAKSKGPRATPNRATRNTNGRKNTTKKPYAKRQKVIDATGSGMVNKTGNAILKHRQQLDRY